MLARGDVSPLVALANRIAQEGGCAQKRDISTLQSKAIRLVDMQRVPQRLQQPFLRGVASLVGQAPPCVPPVRAASKRRTTTATSPIPTAPPTHGHGHGRGHGHEKR